MQEQNLQTELRSEFKMKFIDPEAVLDQIEMEKGIKAADFGCGTGYFSLALAKRAGEDGVVYALDILPQRLESVASNAKNMNLNNIITRRANLEKEEGSLIAGSSIDLVVLKDMLFQNKNKRIILEEAKRTLKPGGKVLIVEWKSEDARFGPEKELRISREALLDIVQRTGLNHIKDIKAGNFHFGLLFVK